MSNNNTLKTPQEDTLRGTGLGSMGWTEGGKQMKNVKRLMKTFDDTVINKSSKKHRIEVTCDTCKKTFKTTNGKLPKHKGDWYSNFYRRTFDPKDTSVKPVQYCDGKIQQKEQTSKTFIIKDIEFVSGDVVLYSALARKTAFSVLKVTTFTDTIKNFKLEKGFWKGEMVDTVYFESGKSIHVKDIIDIIKD